MRENEVAKLVVREALALHRELGPGLLESVYEVLLADLLGSAGVRVERQASVPIRFRDRHFDVGFRADLIVDGIVLVEVKSVERIARVHCKQVLTYLRLCGLRLGLLVNFGGQLLKGNIERIVNGLGGPAE